jgi:hypothetical protein
MKNNLKHAWNVIKHVEHFKRNSSNKNDATSISIAQSTSHNTGRRRGEERGDSPPEAASKPGSGGEAGSPWPLPLFRSFSPSTDAVEQERERRGKLKCSRQVGLTMPGWAEKNKRKPIIIGQLNEEESIKLRAKNQPYKSGPNGHHMRHAPTQMPNIRSSFMLFVNIIFMHI